MILISDFGSQVTSLILRRVVDAGAYGEVVPYDKLSNAMKKLKPRGVILSGGPASVPEFGSPRAPREVFEAGIPVLGICYGQMTMALQLGGTVESGHHREYGRALLNITEPSALFDGVWSPGEQPTVWMSHGDRITALPPGFVVKASSENAPFALIEDEARKFFGLMFHPEVVHTTEGGKLIANFVRNIVGLAGDAPMASFKNTAIAKIRAQVGNGRVICAVSGGVDSTVTAALIHEAIGDQLTCIFVDHGLLNLNEGDEVVELFRSHFNIPLIRAEASDAFFAGLEGVVDPDQKRLIVGRLFIETFEAEAKKLGDVEFLAQGTLQADVIESISPAGGPSVTIKRHHNVGGLPEKMGLKLVEPLRMLFKDQARALGRELGVPEVFIGRHPSPGPANAIRIKGPVTREKNALLQKANAIYTNEIRKAGLYDKIWQAFAVLSEDKTTGVMGDKDAYKSVVVLRAVTSVDAMTADYYEFPPGFLGRVINRITNEVDGIGRGTYDYTSKPPGTIEWE